MWHACRRWRGWRGRPVGNWWWPGVQDAQVDFEFKSRALSLVMGGVFSELVHRMVGAYEARADQLYGKLKSGSFQPAKPVEQKS